MEVFEELKQLGVLSWEIKDRYYAAKIRWKDGKESEHHFPEKGFPVYKLENGKPIGQPLKIISGKEALKILADNSPFMEESEFFWKDFIQPR